MVKVALAPATQEAACKIRKFGDSALNSKATSQPHPPRIPETVRPIVQRQRAPFGRNRHAIGRTVTAILPAAPSVLLLRRFVPAPESHVAIGTFCGKQGDRISGNGDGRKIYLSLFNILYDFCIFLTEFYPRPPDLPHTCPIVLAGTRVANRVMRGGRRCRSARIRYARG
jgi:hypothetical protein